MKGEKMKKKILYLLTSIFLLTTTSAYSLTKIIVEKGNGSSKGYNKVNEWHFQDNNGNWTHKLACWDPGEMKCEWDIRPWCLVLVDYAEDQINNGILKGNYEEIIDGIRHLVEWDALDKFNANIVETVYEDKK
ncbi:MAG: hypothetical protein QXY47_06135 [Thermoplasmata archaeon]